MIGQHIHGGAEFTFIILSDKGDNPALISIITLALLLKLVVKRSVWGEKKKT